MPNRRLQVSRSCFRFSADPESDVRLAAVWCIINLTWKDQASDPTRTQRIQDMKKLGAETLLQGLQDDSDQEVRLRVEGCLKAFNEVLS